MSSKKKTKKMKTNTDDNLSSLQKLKGLTIRDQWNKLILDTWSELEKKDDHDRLTRYRTFCTTTY